MTFWRTAVLAAALVAAGAAGAAFAPAVHGQPEVAPAQASVAQFMRGGGSEIGVTIRDLSDEETKGPKGATPALTRGAIITGLTDGGPAEAAGVKTGDVVTGFDGERIRGARQFARVVEETPTGHRVQMDVMRDGQRTTLTVQTRSGRGSLRLLSGVAPRLREFDRTFKFEMPAIPAPPAAPAPPAPPTPVLPDFDQFFGGGRSAARLGVTIDDLSSQLAAYFGTKDGVLVSSVTDNSAAAKAGLKAGDVITSFNDEPVTSASDLRRKVQRLNETGEFRIGILRDKKPMTLKGKLEPRAEAVRTITT